MDKIARNAYWRIIKGKLLQQYARVTKNEAAYQRGEQDEFMGRFEQRIARRRGLRIIAKKTILTGLFLLAVSSAGAQIGDVSSGGIYLGPQVGFFKSQNADDGRVMPGAAMRIKFAGVLGIEGSINYREEEYGNGSAKVKSWPVMVTGLLYPVPIVYGAIGAGWYNSSIEYQTPLGNTYADETKQDFGWHVGGGLELPLGPSVLLVGDVRYVFLNYNFEHFPWSNGSTSNFSVIDLGLLFRL
jgi:opacity protein-like surface antigen